MMIKKLQLAALAGFVFCAASTNAQLTITSGTTFMIQSGAVVTVQGDIVSNADISGPGKVVLKGSSNQNVNMNGFTIPNLEMDNTSNATLTGNAQIGTNLTFTNGKILTGNFDLTMQSAATITTADNTKYIVTNGTGRLVKASLAATPFTFPIGNTTLTYNPVTIANTGTSDNIGARSLANVLSTGLTGSAFTKEVADASWDISEAVAGGSNLSLTANWLTSDELTGFDRTKSGISYYIPTAGPTLGWDLLNSQTGAAAGAGTGASPYNFTRTGISSLGAFAVGTRPVLSPLLVSPKVFLQGPYNTGTGVMNENLRTGDLIPLSEPYTSIATFAHSGSGGGETTTAAIVGSGAASTNDAIVDWVFVQLHRASDSAVVSTRAALIQRDGDIVETDGVSPLNMAGNAAGNYYISIRHRNHLGVRTPTAFALAKTTTTNYNFTDNISKAYNNTGIANLPMADVTGAGVFGMWGGNANSDVTTRVTGTLSVSDYQRILSTLGGAATVGPVYSPSDINMDGTVRVTGTLSISDYQKILSYLNSSSIITQHL